MRVLRILQSESIMFVLNRVIIPKRIAERTKRAMSLLEQAFGKLTGTTFSMSTSHRKALVLLHGVGSNERDLLEIAPHLADDRLIISLRAPIAIGPSSYAWFHVQFTEQGPVHNWEEASSSLSALEESLQDLSVKSGIPLHDIAVFGFSQGAIMTIGLALRSELEFERYFAVSGRTLPELAEAASRSPLTGYKKRKIFVAHGTLDSKLPIDLARNTEKTLRAAGFQLTYKEYEADHTIPDQVLSDVRFTLESNQTMSKI